MKSKNTASTQNTSETNGLGFEFERQIQNLLAKGYPKIAGITEKNFLKQIKPLKEKLGNIKLPAIDFDKGKLPFVVAVKNTLVPSQAAMSLVDKNGKPGIEKLFPKTPQDFQTIETVEIPGSQIYLLMDIDRGKETLNATPFEAMKTIKRKKRSPLTIDEGIAIITHYPEFLAKNNCFSLLASRIPNDKRVPAIWINAGKNPHLGWCWEGNPHTWLGSASCKIRF